MRATPMLICGLAALLLACEVEPTEPSTPESPAPRP